VDLDERYEQTLARASSVLPGIRVGRPGPTRRFGPIKAVLQVARLGIAIDTDGSDRVRLPAILVGNHLSALDPVVTVLRTPLRGTAFTKLEAYRSRFGFFFRWTGQLPLARGDEPATEWALDMADLVLERGYLVAIYPEGTRGPDHDTLYRLHRRVLVPLITRNPDIPVHVMTTTYPPRRGLRLRARVRVSAPLPIDARTMSADEIVDVIRDALVTQGGLRYVDSYAFVEKRRRAQELEQG
jgi:1-acyl-sn-glycerol-3-phosphate acyltransferase